MMETLIWKVRWNIAAFLLETALQIAPPDPIRDSYRKAIATTSRRILDEVQKRKEAGE